MWQKKGGAPIKLIGLEEIVAFEKKNLKNTSVFFQF